MKQVFSDEFLKFKESRKDYATAIKVACNAMPRANKELYRLILRDLIYHFEPTKTAPTRARVRKKGEMWTVDSYKVITERINKLLVKKVSAKTLQRYHADFVTRGWVICERHMFAGRNTLHRRLNIGKMEKEFIFGYYNSLFKQAKEEEEDEEPNSAQIESAVAEAREKAQGKDPEGQLTPTEPEAETEKVIRFGDLFFGLGLLGNKRKRVTKWARTRIRQLVEADLLSVDAIYTLKDAWENGAFEGKAEPRQNPRYRYWPDWLFDFYPQGRALCRGLAAYWFLEAEPTAHPWLKFEKLERYLACQKQVIPAFERLNRRHRADPQPDDYIARHHDGVTDATRTDVYFKRMYPGQTLPDEILSSSKV